MYFCRWYQLPQPTWSSSYSSAASVLNHQLQHHLIAYSLSFRKTPHRPLRYKTAVNKSRNNSSRNPFGMIPWDNTKQPKYMNSHVILCACFRHTESKTSTITCSHRYIYTYSFLIHNMTNLKMACTRTKLVPFAQPKRFTKEPGYILALWVTLNFMVALTLEMDLADSVKKWNQLSEFYIFS